MSDDHRLSDPRAPATRPIEETQIFSDGTHPEGDSLSGPRPKKFGRYEIKRVLGEGAMGAVLLATDTQLQREVALKIPKFAPDAAPQLLERFFLEARLAATLSHPNICPVFDVGEVDGTHYISMAYIEGHRLSEFIDPEKPQGQRRVALVIRKLALALREAHDKGVVHRDLKPANVMIDKRGEPIIMDFGIALQENTEDTRLTREGQLVGSPAYMSPEQMGGNSGKIGPATDIYSLGVVFYELLSGELPFEGTGSMASIIGQVLTQEPKDLISLRPKLDSQLAAICLKAMAKQIEDRYASMAELADALTQYLKKSQQATVLGIDAHAETKTDLQAVPSAENFLLADLAEVLPPLSQNMATSGTVLRVPSKQRPWLLPTAIGLAVLILACLVWALARDNSQPVPSDHGAPATTTSGDSTPMPKTPAIPVQANPAPPVASQRDNSETRENDALGSSASETIPEKENVESSNASSISAGLLTTKSSAETSAPSNQQSTDLLPSKAPSSSFPESPPRPQSDQVEAPPLPPHPDGKRGPRLGPPPRPGGPLLPRGILIDDFFRDHDKNQDQKLAPDELPAEIRDHLFRADANRDGFLVKKEIRDAQAGPGKRRNGKQPR